MTKKFTIKGKTVTVREDNVNIKDSYTIRKRSEMREFLSLLQEAINKYGAMTDTVFNHRTIKSMVDEWVAHNNLYVLHIERERTKSVDLDYPQKKAYSILYRIASVIAL